MTKKSPKVSKTDKTQKPVEAPTAQELEKPVEALTAQELEKPVEAPPTEKQLKKSISDAELSERLALARTHKGEIVKFLCTKTQDWTIGLIRTARLDKRSGFIQYRIEVLDYPMSDEETINFKNPTGNWLLEDGTIECPVRRTNTIWGKGDDSQDLKVVGHYSATPKVKEETPTEASQEDKKPAKKTKKTDKKPAKKTKKTDKKPAKKTKKTDKKTAPKVSEEDAAMAAAMADMAAEGLL